LGIVCYTLVGEWLQARKRTEERYKMAEKKETTDPTSGVTTIRPKRSAGPVRVILDKDMDLDEMVAALRALGKEYERNKKREQEGTLDE
jgi:hypothetical protein